MRPTFHPRIRRAFCAAAGVLALAACSDPAAPPEPMSTQYVLTSVGANSNPMVLGEHTLPSGTHQLYFMAYDTLQFPSPDRGRRSFAVVVYTRAHDGVSVMPLMTTVVRSTSVTRRGNRIVVTYDPSASPMKPDTFDLRGGKLVKLGPYGVICDGCAATTRVEYVYEPR